MNAMTRMLLEDVWTPRVLSILRIVAALILVAHGAQVLLSQVVTGFTAGVQSMSRIAALLELTGGGLLVFGLLTRLVAAILAVHVAVTYWALDVPQEPSLALTGGDAAILCCFVLLYVVFAGPGPWSVDQAWGRRRTVRTGPLS